MFKLIPLNLVYRFAHVHVHTVYMSIFSNISVFSNSILPQFILYPIVPEIFCKRTRLISLPVFLVKLTMFSFKGSHGDDGSPGRPGTLGDKVGLCAE